MARVLIVEDDPYVRSAMAAADSLIGNIFKHTAEGTGFAVTVHRGEGAVLVFVADAGPGIADPDAAGGAAAAARALPASGSISPVASPSPRAAG